MRCPIAIMSPDICGQRCYCVPSALQMKLMDRNANCRYGTLQGKSGSGPLRQVCSLYAEEGGDVHGTGPAVHDDAWTGLGADTACCLWSSRR